MQGSKLPNFTPVEKVDTLQTNDTQEGTGQAAQASDTVTVKYTGAYASDGVIFDSSDMHGGQPISFPLNGVIKGWTDGIPGMKVGGKRRLLIPAELAYGATPPQGIRANADMVFDVELVKIGQ
ncbi:MAG TPA: FKBP-type peptidyl-prolyl cis-trans isomerase [Patescibacteria group bacterium]|nr:FKBP-type peptidyl-prolyl cis-trans isomerase [Patescibacteria group bacterium]